jgi:hypothetical protein
MLVRRQLALASLAIAALISSQPSAVADTPSTSTAARPDGDVIIRPAVLERGGDPAVPVLLRTTILDGNARIHIRAQEVQLLGTSGDDYVVGVWQRDGKSRVDRVGVDGARAMIMDDFDGDLVLSRDGKTILETVVRPGGTSIVTARDAVTGDRLARQPFHGYIRVLDAGANRAILGGTSPTRTFSWNVRTGRTSRISTREGYFADLDAGLLATVTTRSLSGAGCSVLAPLSSPRQELWRSCRQAVVASSPNGRRLLTEYIFMDGPVAKVSVHRRHGGLIASYRSTGWIGRVGWETNRSILITAYGAGKTAIVRCQVADCDRASKRVDTPPH